MGNGNALIDPDSLWLDAEKLALLKDVPMWLVFSSDDMVVPPELYELPTYAALIQAEAENCHLSVFSGYGHGVWSAFFKNLVAGVQDPAAFASVEIPGPAAAGASAYPVTPDAEKGGALSVGEYACLFDWLNAQSK